MRLTFHAPPHHFLSTDGQTVFGGGEFEVSDERGQELLADTTIDVEEVEASPPGSPSGAETPDEPQTEAEGQGEPENVTEEPADETDEPEIVIEGIEPDLGRLNREQLDALAASTYGLDTTSAFTKREVVKAIEQAKAAASDAEPTNPDAEADDAEAPNDDNKEE